MGKKDKVMLCCKCKLEITGFIAYEDANGKWCEDCLNEYTCQECGEINEESLDNGKCISCDG